MNNYDKKADRKEVKAMKLQDVKFLPMKGKDYDNCKIVGVPWMNFPEHRDWMQKHWGLGVSQEMFDKGCLINGDNRERFKRLFGKRAFVFNGGEGHYFHGWLADLETAQVLVLTAREHGTCYEVVVKRDGVKIRKDIKRVLEFMDMIAELPE